MHKWHAKLSLSRVNFILIPLYVETYKGMKCCALQDHGVRCIKIYKTTHSSTIKRKKNAYTLHIT